MAQSSLPQPDSFQYFGLQLQSVATSMATLTEANGSCSPKYIELGKASVENLEYPFPGLLFFTTYVGIQQTSIAQPKSCLQTNWRRSLQFEEELQSMVWKQFLVNTRQTLANPHTTVMKSDDHWLVVTLRQAFLGGREAPMLWNALPAEIQEAPSIETFHLLLKTSVRHTYRLIQLFSSFF